MFELLKKSLMMKYAAHWAERQNIYTFGNWIAQEIYHFNKNFIKQPRRSTMYLKIIFVSISSAQNAAPLVS